MTFEEAIDLIKTENFCDSMKSNDLSYDLTKMKNEVIPALLKRVDDLQNALHRESDNMFKTDNKIEIKM